MGHNEKKMAWGSNTSTFRRDKVDNVIVPCDGVKGTSLADPRSEGKRYWQETVSR